MFGAESLTGDQHPIILAARHQAKSYGIESQ
jgi:hypothetical protein